MNGILRFRWMVGFAILFVSGLAGCMLETGGLAHPDVTLDVKPQFICPGETVTLSWDVPSSDPCFSGGEVIGGDAPINCSTITSLTSSPSVTMPVEGTETMGHQFVSTSSTTTFNLDARQCTETIGCHSVQLETSVEVVPGAGIFPITFEGICFGSTPAHRSINLKETLSPCLEVTQICGDPRNDGAITVRGSSSGDTNNLDLVDTLNSPDECTTELNRARLITIEPASGFNEALGLRGTLETGGRPQDMFLRLHLTCNIDLENCEATP